MPLRIPRLMAFGGAMLLATVSLPALAGGELRTFGNWIVGCDNRAECTAIGLAEKSGDQAAPAVAFRIGPDATSITGFEFAVIPLPEGQSAKAITVTCLLCSNGVKAPGEVAADQVVLRGRRVVLPGIESAKWLDALAKRRGIAVASVDGTLHTTIDSSSFTEAWIHLAQTRGNVMREAMIAGSLPSLNAGQPKADSKRAYPSKEVISSGFPEIERLKQKCPAGAEVERYRQFQLPGEASLWAVACRQAGKSMWHWFRSNGSSEAPTALELPDGNRGRINAGADGLGDSVFDFDFGTLRARTGPPSREDCGIQHAWGWDGKAWFLLERREMPVCIGLAPPDWIRTYASP